MASLFRVTRAACFAADGSARSLKVGDTIEDTDPIFSAMDPKGMVKVEDIHEPHIIVPEPAPMPEPKPVPTPEHEKAEEIPEPVPHETLYNKRKAKRRSE
jgi:hypothetical protein